MSTSTWAHCMLSWHCKCGKTDPIWDLFRARISPHVIALHSLTWRHQTHHSCCIASLSFPMISPLAQLSSNKMMEIATQRRRDCGVKWWRLRHHSVAIKKHLHLFIINNRNRTLLQLLVDGGKASGYKEDLSIRFGNREEHCALYLKRWCCKIKGHLSQLLLAFSFEFVYLCRHRKLDFV